MRFEWLLIGAVLTLALVPVARKLRFGWAWAFAFGVAALTAGAGVVWQKQLDRRTVSREQLLKKTPREGRPGGYVGSGSCQACHPSEYASWHDSFHRTMTQHATPESVRGNFEHTELELDGEKYRFERRGDEYWVEMVDPDWKYRQAINKAREPTAGALQPANAPRVWRRIGMLTGSHHMQAYWVWSQNGNLQFSLPFTYIFESQRWAPRNDVFLLKPNAPHVQQIWNMTCINCHSTAGQSRQNAFTKQFETRAAELGIACEACHGPADDHVRRNTDPARRYALHRRGETDSTIVNPARLDHVKASETCSRCHAIRYNPDKAAWNEEGVRFHPGGDIEGNAPLASLQEIDPNLPDSPDVQRRRALMLASFWSDGQVRVSGRDFNGMAASACYQRGQLACTSCHSMHQYHSNDDQLAMHMEGNQACLQCHGAYATKLEAHTHHAPGSSGSLCYNCHMPHTSYGLLKAIRSHTINSPSVTSSLKTGRPNACNLCHLDKTLDWTQSHLGEWYQTPAAALGTEEKETAAAVLWLLRGDAGQRVLIAWHMGWEPALEASGRDWLAPYLAETLTDTYSVVRYVGQRSLKRLSGFESLPYDYIGPVGDRVRARERALEVWQSRSPAKARIPVLLQADGNLDSEKFARLLRERKDPPMELFE